MSKQLLFNVLLILALTASAIHCREANSNSGDNTEGEDVPTSTSSSWWSGFKAKVKSVLSRWREDIKLLWDDVLAKARDMRGWTSEVFESLKVKLKEWVETRKELPDDEKNEIETFISKLKVPTDAPGTGGGVDERKKILTDKKIDP